MDKIETLKKNYEFKKVLNSGKYYIKEQIIVYINKNKKDKNRIGIAINTKLCHAVLRNRLKRLIRENYRQEQSKLSKGYDIVFLWNKRVEPQKADFYKINADMKQAFLSAGMLEDKEEE